MKTTIITVILLIFVFTSSCDDTESLECPVQTVEELEAFVKGNSLTLLKAVEAFANDNYGHYPANSDSDTTVTGEVLIDYLPGGERLINPYTGLRDQPVDSIPLASGELGDFLDLIMGFLK